MMVMIFALFRSKADTFATTLSTDIPGTECKKNLAYVAVPKNPDHHKPKNFSSTESITNKYK